MRKKPRNKYKARLRTEVEFLKEMKSRPVPIGSSLHTSTAEYGAIAELLDRELVDGACARPVGLRNLWAVKPARGT